MFFFASADQLPKTVNRERASLGLQHWNEQLAKLEDDAETDLARSLTENPLGRRLLEGLFSNSPFLTQCAVLEAPFFARLLRDGRRGRHVARDQR